MQNPNNTIATAETPDPFRSKTEISGSATQPSNSKALVSQNKEFTWEPIDTGRFSRLGDNRNKVIEGCDTDESSDSIEEGLIRHQVTNYGTISSNLLITGGAIATSATNKNEETFCGCIPTGEKYSTPFVVIFTIVLAAICGLLLAAHSYGIFGPLPPAGSNFVSGGNRTHI